MFTGVFPFSFLIPVFIQDMTKDQIANEKVALQKALLYYESIHGRPVCDTLHFLIGVNCLTLEPDFLCSVSYKWSSLLFALFTCKGGLLCMYTISQLFKDSVS